MYHYTDGGLRNVWLANGFKVQQTPFGEAVTFDDSDGLTQAICQALAAKTGILTGVELRYIRSAGMGLSQPALGRQMGIDGQSIARWEKSGKVPRWADKLTRLLYAGHAQGNEPICQLMERLKTAEQGTLKQRIVVQGGHAQWMPALSQATDAVAG